MKYYNITFIGSGNIAEAIMSGIIRKGYPSNLITVCSPYVKKKVYLLNNYDVITSDSNIYGINKSEIIFFSVKPHQIKDVFSNLENKVSFNKKLIISVIAGLSVNKLHSFIGYKDDINIVRLMPNIACFIGEGFTGVYGDCNKNYKNFLSNILNMLGKYYWFKKEHYIDKVISISSSAQAYFFLLMEIIKKQALNLNFDSKIVNDIVSQVVFGAAMMAKVYDELSFLDFINKISSKKGTTVEAIKILKNYGIYNMFDVAMKSILNKIKDIENDFN